MGFTVSTHPIIIKTGLFFSLANLRIKLGQICTCTTLINQSHLWEGFYCSYTGAVARTRLCRRMQLRAVTGGRRRKAWLNATKWKGRSSVGRKVATRCASPSDQSLTSQICRRTVSTARRVCQVASTLVVGVRSGAKTGHFPTDRQPSPVLSAVHLAVKCNSSHCGIKTDSTHKRRRSETRTQGGETGAASGRGGKRSSRRRWGRQPRTLSLYSVLNPLCARQEFRWSTGTCPAMTESEEDHHFHYHPLVEDHSPPNGACCALVVRKRSRERKNLSVWQKPKRSRKDGNGAVRLVGGCQG